jgi:hypothetical protein
MNQPFGLSGRTAGRPAPTRVRPAHTRQLLLPPRVQPVRTRQRLPPTGARPVRTRQFLLPPRARLVHTRQRLLPPGVWPVRTLESPPRSAAHAPHTGRQQKLGGASGTPEDLPGNMLRMSIRITQIKSKRTLDFPCLVLNATASSPADGEQREIPPEGVL